MVKSAHLFPFLQKWAYHNTFYSGRAQLHPICPSGYIFCLLFCNLFFFPWKLRDWVFWEDLKGIPDCHKCRLSSPLHTRLAPLFDCPYGECCSPSDPAVTSSFLKQISLKYFRSSVRFLPPSSHAINLHLLQIHYRLFSDKHATLPQAS